MNPTILDLLNNDSSINQLPLLLRQELANVARVKNAKQGSFIYRKGDAPLGLLRLIEGTVRIGATTLDGNDLLLTTMKPSQWFGEISILDGLPRTHDAIAQEDCVYALFPMVQIRRLFKQYPELYSLIVSLLCAHIRTAFTALDDFLLLSPAQRLARRVLHMSSVQSADEPELIELNQQDLSDLIGVSRQTISKILKAWEQHMFIKRVYGGIEVHSRDGLNTLLSNTPK